MILKIFSTIVKKKYFFYFLEDTVQKIQATGKYPITEILYLKLTQRTYFYIGEIESKQMKISFCLLLQIHAIQNIGVLD